MKDKTESPGKIYLTYYHLHIFCSDLTNCFSCLLTSAWWLHQSPWILIKTLHAEYIWGKVLQSVSSSLSQLIRSVGRPVGRSAGRPVLSGNSTTLVVELASSLLARISAELNSQVRPDVAIKDMRNNNMRCETTIGDAKQQPRWRGQQMQHQVVETASNPPDPQGSII